MKALLGPLRLRHKLAISLSLAALLPVVVASTVAVRTVLGSLEGGLHDQTARQLRVAMNLVLRNVERLGGDAVRLASTPALVEAIDQGDLAVTELLAREDPHLPSALVEVADAQGRVMAARAMGGNRGRYARLGVAAGSAAIQSGLEYERRVSIFAMGQLLVVRAVAPIVDPSYALRGVVVVSLPFDGDFADSIKGALGTNVLFHAGSAPAMSSFVDRVGGRATGIEAPPGVAAQVLAGGAREARTVIGGHEFQLGYAPIKNLAGEHVGMLGVAVRRGALLRAKAVAAGSLGLGAAGAIALALVLATLLARRLTKPIASLHAGALAVARGDLDVRHTRVEGAEGDEIGDLAAAFSTMTSSLRENQERLAARMREIVALHEAGRAVSSVLGLGEVLRKIVESVSRVMDARLTALWIVASRDGRETGPIELVIGSARAKPAVLADGYSHTLIPEDSAELASPLSGVALHVAETRTPLRLDPRTEGPFAEAARQATIDGSLLAIPLERLGLVVGVLIVGRYQIASAFTDADESLLSTFADQAATAIENARLYEEVRAFSEELEEKVRLRTLELTTINAELGRALHTLKETQSQLVLSERLAGLGALVAGVAHEINSPSAAIRGSVDALEGNVRNLARRVEEAGELGMPADKRRRFLALADELAPKLAEKRVASPADVRRKARELTATFSSQGVDADAASTVARSLAELGAEEAAEPVLSLGGPACLEVLCGYLREYTYLLRNAAAIGSAIKHIQRIVGALKSYSHLDQVKAESADVHEGIENTLVILHHELKYGISVVRKYGQLPKLPIYVDELNQVWTNLIHNAVQALGGRGEIIIETLPPEAPEGAAVVRVIDNGPGIPGDVLPRIFEPFFTTKAKGEGTGLGLGIVKSIVDKHGGRVTVDSCPGRTCFSVALPVMGPQAQRMAEAEAG
jgi:signal transduction histidine kinase